ncbi:MAG: segregation/condensation protein A [Rhizobiales bacterium 17-65-6]|nr:MAG: segregation/condensation protein A [Rhizobiales bacterium 12-68-15]OYX87042.1 MAG: segregation/condensation protein A [Azorhizobium sp. 32-67-21]OYY10656.1 MAG: segregation/condensation protein A [Rhizobiales bacterium 35-68-8]OZA00484.1 MAG: segregation/condensation protein A [Rhizobiales bacterium 17-65-6]
MDAPVSDFAEDTPAETGEGAFVVDIDGFEGPLDLLLALARTQKIDLSRLSILALADQYLAFIDQARKVRLELAADYLVMAAWLAYLKSRLLLPPPPKEDGPSAEELADAFARRLRHLERIRKAAELMMARTRLGLDVFARAVPRGEAPVPGRVVHDASLYDLLSAYATQRQRSALSYVTLKTRAVWSLAEARARLEKLVGGSLDDWMRLDQFLADYLLEPGQRATALASSFSATLEMVREGLLDVRQDAPFAPLWLRPRGTQETLL